MNRKKGGRAVAVIDIGSNMLKMRVSQLQNGKICDLDRLEYPIRLGHEVFLDNKISFESLRELSGILKGFSRVMEEYGVSQYKTVATTVFREALNRSYIVDQLKIQNDMSVDILEDDQEKTLIYSEILRALSSGDLPKISNALIAYIGTGSIGVTVYGSRAMLFSQNIPMGSLKLHDLLSGIQDQTNDFYTVLDEYVDTIIGRLSLPLPGKALDGLIITGNEIERIARMCGVPLKNGRYTIKAKLIAELYETVRVMTPERISMTYELSESEAEVLYSALAIYCHILKLTSAKSIVSPKIELWDALIRQMLFPKSHAEYDEHVRLNALSCAKVLAEHYNCNLAHQETVRQNAVLLFDKLKKVHGLAPKKRLFLELAALLHEAGYYVNTKYHLECTYDLIKNTDLYGLTEEEVELTANIAKYNEFAVPTTDDEDYAHLTEKNKLVVSKLAAIFRLANALDISQKQKLRSVKLRVTEDTLLITGESDENLHLEKWAVEECAPFFEEVFGLHPHFQLKSLLF